MPDTAWLEIVRRDLDEWYVIAMRNAATGVIPDGSEGPFATAREALAAARAMWPALVTREMEEAIGDE